MWRSNRERNRKKLKKGVDISWEACIINNCRCPMRVGKEHILVIDSECLGRKTLTSEITSDIIVSADMSSKKAQEFKKEIEKSA